MISSRNLSILLIVFLMIPCISFAGDSDGTSGYESTAIPDDSYRTLSQSTTDIRILLLMDENFGTAYMHIQNNFESYGWNVTIAGTHSTMTSCASGGFSTLVPDILFTDISDITVYDAISIMPGNSHDILRTNETSLNLIQSAVAEGLVVSAWCRAVRVLAAADVLDGKNITGNADYEAEYLAAGATFNELVPPIIDGNIVTSVRSMYWRLETYQAIATALGVFDGAPEIADVSCTPSIMTNDSSSTLSVTFDDGIWVDEVEVDIFLLDDAGERVNENSSLSLDLQSSEVGVYTTELAGLDDGNYSLDLIVVDVFQNELIYSDVAALAIGVFPDAPFSLPSEVILIGIAIGAVVIVAVIIVKLKGKLVL